MPKYSTEQIERAKNVDVRSYKDIKGIIAQRTDSITVRTVNI